MYLLACIYCIYLYGVWNNPIQSGILEKHSLLELIVQIPNGLRTLWPIIGLEIYFSGYTGTKYTIVSGILVLCCLCCKNKMPTVFEWNAQTEACEHLLIADLALHLNRHACHTHWNKRFNGPNQAQMVLEQKHGDQFVTAKNDDTCLWLTTGSEMKPEILNVFLLLFLLISPITPLP